MFLSMSMSMSMSMSLRNDESAKKCEEPSDILNGYRVGECYDYSCRVEYVCQTGFEIVGQSRYRYCQADGTWSPRELPSCKRTSRACTMTDRK